MNCLDDHDLETSIIIQKEIDKCNEKMKNYEIKYNTEKKDSLKIIYAYLNEQLIICDDSDKKIIMDDLETLTRYLD